MSEHQQRPRVSTNPYRASLTGAAWDRGYHESMHGMVFGANPYLRVSYSRAWIEGWKFAQSMKANPLGRGFVPR